MRRAAHHVACPLKVIYIIHAVVATALCPLACECCQQHLSVIAESTSDILARAGGALLSAGKTDMQLRLHSRFMSIFASV